jgi:membrane-bound lytic murein transglycosylase B
MRRVANIGLLTVLLLAPAARADERGWTFLRNRLIADGVDRDRVVRAFDDPRMPAFSGLDFSPERPREPRSMYRRFLRPSGVARARRCRARYAGAFEGAERITNVPANVLAAILFVETECGCNTGSHLVLHRVARLAMANEPENLQRNLARFTAGSGVLDRLIESRLRERARHLEETFYPEVRATFGVAERLRLNPLDLRGSLSGAFGYPQFLPSSFLRHGTDGDGNGVVSLYDPADAAASAASYLAFHGWRPGVTRTQRRAVLWQYNRSQAYIDTVLALAERLQAAPVHPRGDVVPSVPSSGAR